jgi:putative Ca2+/H+ antiporter (TMEM165/GDT1 family)
MAGAWLSQHIDERQLSTIAGLGFVAIGLWTLFR